MFLIAPINSRNDFGRLLAARGLTGHAVEVGTHRGVFARTLLDSWPGMLHCVDPWSIPPGYEEQGRQLPSVGGHGDREDDYQECKQALAPHRSRVHLMRMTSVEAVVQFKAGSLDFVYVDGDHREAQAYEDLCLWWLRLRPGGILAGHDFLCPGEPRGGWSREVQPAVLRFAYDQKHVDVYLVMEPGLPWSFYMEKP